MGVGVSVRLKLTPPLANSPSRAAPIVCLWLGCTRTPSPLLITARERKKEKKNLVHEARCQYLCELWIRLLPSFFFCSLPTRREGWMEGEEGLTEMRDEGKGSRDRETDRERKKRKGKRQTLLKEKKMTKEWLFMSWITAVK